MWPWPAEWAPGKTGSTAERGFWVPITEDKNHLPKADKRTAGRQASVLPVNGGGDDRFQNLYGYFGAADEKVPLLMVCVKRKPLHLVFYLRLGESSFIIPGICLWRNAGRCIQSGFGGFGRAAENDSLGSYLGRSFKGGSATLRGYARGVGGTRRRTCAVSVDGCGRCGEWRQN
jgi:hypothetical protein